MFLKINLQDYFRLLMPIFTMLVIVACPGKSFAFDPNSTAPIEIESDMATIDDKTGTSTYSGNVIVSQGTTKLEAEFISVTSQDRRITGIKAIGNPAHFSQQVNNNPISTHGYGKEISYRTQDETLIFKGDAKLIQADNSFSGEIIEYDVIKRAIKARGNQREGSRVKIQYYPEGTTKKEKRAKETEEQP